MNPVQKKFDADLKDDDLVQPHVLCERCQHICNQSQLLRVVPTKYTKKSTEEPEDAGLSQDDVEESYTHGTISEIEASCLEGCFLCTRMYYSSVRAAAPGGEDPLKAARESPDRFRLDIIARESTR
jgi:hypothetical protein